MVLSLITFGNRREIHGCYGFIAKESLTDASADKVSKFNYAK
jgi:hypothetical protein